MKNLKKLVSVILTVAMLLSSLAALSVSAYGDVDETNSYAKAIEVLSGLGIAKGDDNGNFNPTAEVKRSEMVAFVCRMKGEEAIATSTEQKFDDVPSNHWAAGYINWGVASEIINGVGDNKFDPDSTVTLRDAATMIVRAAGWERVATRKEYGGYPVGHLKIANTRGVLEGVESYGATKAATREVIAQIVYNGLTMPTVEYTHFGEKVENDSYQIMDGTNGSGSYRTLLTDTNKIYKVRAYVAATAKSAPATYKTAAGDQVSLTSLAYYGANGKHHADLNDGAEVAFVGESTVADYLGQIVETYLVKDGQDWFVLAAVPADDVASEEIVKADVYSFVDVVVGAAVSRDSNNVVSGEYTFEYLLNATDSREKEIDFYADADIYYNGALLAENTVYDATVRTDVKNILMNASKIEFVGTKNEPYSAIFVTEYDYKMVTKVNVEDEYISWDGGSIELSEKQRGEIFTYNLYDAKGKAIELEDIKEDDILNFVAADDGADTSIAPDIYGADYLDIYVTNETVTGTVTEENSAGDAWKIDGEFYKAVAGAKGGVGSLKAKDTGIFYLTIDGLVFDKDATSTLSKNFAFLVEAKEINGDWGKTLKVKLFTGEGKLETFVVADKASVTAATTVDYDKDLTSGNNHTKLATDLTAKVVTGTKAAVSASLNNRICTYRTNSEGEIKELLFKGNDLVTANAIAKLTFNDSLDRLGNKYITDSSVLFVAPVTLVKGGTTYEVKEEDITIGTFSVMEDKEDYNAYIFNFKGESDLAAAVTDEEITSAIKTSHFAVVKSRTTALDAEDNSVTKYTFVQGKEIVELLVSDNAKKTVYKNLATGDIFRYAVNGAGEINQMEFIYDASAVAFGADAATYAYNPATIANDKIAIVKGNVVDVNKGVMRLDTDYNFNYTKKAEDQQDANDIELSFNTTEGNTYASVALNDIATKRENAVEVKSGYGTIKVSDATRKYEVVAIISGDDVFEDCVMYIK